MRLIDGEHLKRWILARWHKIDSKTEYPLKAIDIIDQIDYGEIEYNVNQWIPVSERLPDGAAYEKCLVQDKEGRMAVGTYSNWGWMFGHYVNTHVAWMPLPEPWKGEEG